MFGLPLKMCSGVHKVAKLLGLGTTGGTMAVSTGTGDIVPIPYITNLLHNAHVTCGIDVLCYGLIYLMSYAFIFWLATELAESVCNAYDNYRKAVNQSRETAARNYMNKLDQMASLKNEIIEEMKRQTN